MYKIIPLSEKPVARSSTILKIGKTKFGADTGDSSKVNGNDLTEKKQKNYEDDLIKDSSDQVENVNVMEFDTRTAEEDNFTWHELWKKDKGQKVSIIDDIKNQKTQKKPDDKQKQIDDKQLKKQKTNPSLRRLQSKRHVNIVGGDDEDSENEHNDINPEGEKKLILMAQKLDLVEKLAADEIEDELDILHRMKREKKQLDMILKRKQTQYIRADSNTAGY
jgi:hypothetical protein